MNIGQLRRLNAATCSLHNSTSAQIAVRGFWARVWGRQSPYKTHQQIEFESGGDEVIPFLCAASNHSYCLLLCELPYAYPPDLPPLKDERLEYTVVTVPGTIVGELITDADDLLTRNRSIGRRLDGQLVMAVLIGPKFLGYDNFGSPKFAAVAVPSLTDLMFVEDGATPVNLWGAYTPERTESDDCEDSPADFDDYSKYVTPTIENQD